MRCSFSRVRPLLAGVTFLIVGVVATLSVPAVASAATVVNGDFETGNFTGWTVVNLVPPANWFVYSGTSSPLSGHAIDAPPGGTYAAVTDQFGPSSNVLYQDVALEPGFKHTLSFDIYYKNWAGSFVTPDSLNPGVRNQQYRVDIMKPSAPVTSVAPGDVLATVFQTKVGDPLTMAPTKITFDLSPYAGTTVRLRFAEVDTDSFFNASVDNVQIASVDNDLALVGMPSDQTVNATSPSGAVVTFTMPTASDEDSPPTATVSCDHASGETFPIGTTKVTCTATDADDANSPVSASFNITVLGASDQLPALCTASQGVGPGTSLADKCGAAQKALAAGDTGEAKHILNAYIHEVKAQRGKKIPPATADKLIAAAEQIIAVIGP